MRICLISREYPPDTGWGGIATFTRHLAHGLKDLGHEVVVVSLAKDKAKVDDDQGITVHRVEPHSIPGELSALSLSMSYTRYVLRTSSGLWQKFLELHKEKPFDVVDTPELLAEGWIPAVTKACPLVIRLYTPHSKFIAEKLHNVSKSFDHELVAAFERVAMRWADVLTSPSDDLADFVACDLNYDRSDIHIVHNPIDPVQFSPEGNRSLEKENNRPIILFIGRLEKRKGIHYLIDAVPKVLKHVPDAQFVIIGDDTRSGDGHTPVLAGLKETIAKYGCGASVKFINRVPLSDLPAYYRSADLCVVPSLYDNSPYTCLEAMSCGRAVVGTSGGGMPEYLGDTGVIVPPKDADALAGAISSLLLDDKERNRLGQAARERVLLLFQRAEIARKTVALYELAHKRFLDKKSEALYTKDADQMLVDADFLFYSFDKMIYDYVYIHSLPFKAKHWWRLVCARPRLIVAMTFMALWRTAKNLFGIQSEPLWVEKLSREIAIKQCANPVEVRYAEMTRELLLKTNYVC